MIDLVLHTITIGSRSTEVLREEWEEWWREDLQDMRERNVRREGWEDLHLYMQWWRSGTTHVRRKEGVRYGNCVSCVW